MTVPTAVTRPARRSRRTSREVRQLVLDAAVEAFAEAGFGGATTRDIAQRAGVHESTMFRIFPTKEALFEAAILDPFQSFLAEFRDHWMAEPVPGGEPEQVLREFVTEIIGLVRRHRSLIVAMNSAGAAVPATAEAFENLEQVGTAMAAHYGVQFDVPVAVRIASLAVVAVGVAEDVVFPPSAGFTIERVVDEMVRMLVGSTLYRPNA